MSDPDTTSANELLGLIQSIIDDLTNSLKKGDDELAALTSTCAVMKDQIEAAQSSGTASNNQSGNLSDLIKNLTEKKKVCDAEGEKEKEKLKNLKSALEVCKVHNAKYQAIGDQLKNLAGEISTQATAIKLCNAAGPFGGDCNKDSKELVNTIKKKQKELEDLGTDDQLKSEIKQLNSDIDALTKLLKNEQYVNAVSKCKDIYDSFKPTSCDEKAMATNISNQEQIINDHQISCDNIQKEIGEADKNAATANNSNSASQTNSDNLNELNDKFKKLCQVNLDNLKSRLKYEYFFNNFIGKMT